VSTNRTLAVFAALASLLSVPAAGQTPRPGQRAAATPKASSAFTPPRTPWGDPDLQGIFTNKNEQGIPLERPRQFEGRNVTDVSDAELAALIQQRQQALLKLAPTFGGEETGAGPIHWFENYNAKNSRAWMIIDPPDGLTPARTPEALKRAADLAAMHRARGEADSYEDRSLYDRCVTRGIPGSMMPTIYGMSYQVVQGPGYVAIRYEMIHEARIIPLDGRPHVGSNLRTYMGDARGHWDGNTLVVETTNFNGRTGADNGYPSPEQGTSTSLRIVERFKPVSAGVIEWSVTMEDAQTWTRPWTFAMNLTRDATEPIFEYACHEGNYGLRNILSAARAEERSR
jgi:hypothetical protein